MMLQCWRHNATRRPSFIQLLDQLVPDLSDNFRSVSYYFSHEPENDDADADNDFMNGSADETVPFRTASTTDPSNTAADSKVSDARNLSDEKEQQLCRSVRHSSTEEKPRNTECIEMSRPKGTTATNTAQSSVPPGRQMDSEQRRKSQESSTGTGAGCRVDIHSAADSGSKESSGSSQGSHKNGLINGHIIPFSGVLPSEVH